MSTLSLRDEADLRAYFGSYQPPVPGSRSNFGAVCTRLERGQRPNSDERPTPGTSWTEIVDCGHGDGTTNFDGEDAMIAYVDARWRFRRVSEALARMAVRDVEVLEAYYGTTPADISHVAVLTTVARERNRAGVARGTHKAVAATAQLMVFQGGAGESAGNDLQGAATQLLAFARDAYRVARSRAP